LFRAARPNWQPSATPIGLELEVRISTLVRGVRSLSLSGASDSSFDTSQPSCTATGSTARTGLLATCWPSATEPSPFVIEVRVMLHHLRSHQGAVRKLDRDDVPGSGQVPRHDAEADRSAESGRETARGDAPLDVRSAAHDLA